MNVAPGYQDRLAQTSDTWAAGRTRTVQAVNIERISQKPSHQLFVQKYQLYLPDREALRRELELSLREVEP